MYPCIPFTISYRNKYRYENEVVERKNSYSKTASLEFSRRTNYHPFTVFFIQKKINYPLKMMLVYGQ